MSGNARHGFRQHRIFGNQTSANPPRISTYKVDRIDFKHSVKSCIWHSECKRLAQRTLTFEQVFTTLKYIK